MSRILPLVLAAGLGGCIGELELSSDARVLCESDDECPDGLFCSPNGRCRPDTGDTTGPTLQSATGTSPTTVLLAFDEPIAAQSAEAPSHYSITITGGSGAVSVVAATLGETEQTVTLEVAGLVPGWEHQLTATDITDLAGNAIVDGSVSFVAFGTRADLSAPLLLAPPPHAAFDTRIESNVLLAWKASTGVDAYDVQISSDELFSTVTEEVTGLVATSYTFTLPTQEVTVYWRVRASLPGAEWSQSTIEPNVGILYVSCPKDAYCGPPTLVDGELKDPEAGNRSAPFRSIARAVLVAGAAFQDTPEKIEVRVARRGEGTDNVPYGSFQIIPGNFDLPEGVSVRGGYDADFSTQSLALPDLTRVEGNGTVVRAVNIRYATREAALEGLSIEARGIGGQTVTALQILDSNDELTVSNCHLTVQGSPNYGAALMVLDNPDPFPVFSNNRISTDVSGAVRVVGIDLAGIVPQLVGNSIVLEGSANTATGVELRRPVFDRGSLELRGLRLTARMEGIVIGLHVAAEVVDIVDAAIDVEGSVSGTGIALDRPLQGIVRDSQVYVGPGSSSSVGIRVADAVTQFGSWGTALVNNVIWAGAAPTSYGIDLIDSNHVAVAFNTVSAAAGDGASEFDAAAIRLVRSRVIVVNNILGVRTPVGVGIADTSVWPRYASNNAFVGSVKPFASQGSSDPNTTGHYVCDVLPDYGCELAVLQDNWLVGDDWATIIEAPMGPGADVLATLATNDWRIAAGDPGGLESSGLDMRSTTDARRCLTGGHVDGTSYAPGADPGMGLCGWYMDDGDPVRGIAPQPFEGVDLDAAGTTRAASPSVGAFE